MSNIVMVIFWSLVGGLFSLIVVGVYFISKKGALSLAKIATSFAAGSLLAAAFFDLLTEAVHLEQIETALAFCLVGIIGFFLLENFISVFHHHHNEDDRHHKTKLSLIVIGDTVHNFIDGIAIGAAFLINPASGITTALVVALHEIPQEIGDFGLMLSKNVSKTKALVINIISSLASTIGAVAAYFLADRLSLSIPVLLGITAGFFIYIAVSDIIPEIQKSGYANKKNLSLNSLLLVSGAVISSVLISLLHE